MFVFGSLGGMHHALGPVPNNETSQNGVEPPYSKTASHRSEARMTGHPTRREWLAVGAAGLLASTAPAADRDRTREPFGYMLNMSTIRGQTLDPAEQVEIAA